MGRDRALGGFARGARDEHEEVRVVVLQIFDFYFFLEFRNFLLYCIIFPDISCYFELFLVALDFTRAII